ncbi:MAG: hypothetical protein WCK11_04220 [Candidatus Falkowbacteria bacterium]
MNWQNIKQFLAKDAWFYLLWLVFGLFLLQNGFAYLDNDFGWHLGVGKEIMKSGQVPWVESHLYTLAGTTWVDHEWMFNAFVYLVYTYLGYFFLQLIFVAIILLPLLLLYNYKIAHFKFERFWFMFFAGLGIFACRAHFGVRLQEIALLNITILLVLLDRFVKNKNFTYLFWLIPLFIFWANMHASFLLGLAVLYGWLVIKIVESILAKYSNSLKFINFNYLLSKIEIFKYSMVVVLITISTLLTPYGLKLYDFLFTYTDKYYLSHIEEWLPEFVGPSLKLGRISLFLVFIVSLLVLTLFQKKYKPSIPFPQITFLYFILVIGLIFSSLMVRRNLPILFIIGLPWLAYFYTIEFGVLSENFFSLSWLKKIYKFFIFTPIILLIFGLILKISLVSDPFKSYCGYMPCTLTVELKKILSNSEGKLFASYDWGGFLYWVWPERQLYLDGRVPQQYFGKHSILEEYNKIIYETGGLKKLERQGVKAILYKKKVELKPTKIDEWLFGFNANQYNKKAVQLQEDLKNSQLWQNVYNDRFGEIYIKKDDTSSKNLKACKT